MPLSDHIDTEEIFDPIDWNRIQDDIDLEVWNRLNTNLWLPEKIALSNDLSTWANLTDTEKLVTMRVFAGLTLLDTIQGTMGAISLLPDAVTPHEEAVLTQIAYMESVHARSYSSIFSTLSNTTDIDAAFRWARENPELQKKARVIVGRYRDTDPLMRKAASTILESFLFYSGFYIAFKWASMAKLTNTADIIRLILRDECLSGDTELLTPTGWKSAADITESDRVMQWHPDGGMDFTNPVQVSSHQAQTTYRITSENGGVQQHVSPNHRVIIQRDGELVEHRAEDLRGNLDLEASFINTGIIRDEADGTDILTLTERLAIAISAEGMTDNSGQARYWLTLTDANKISRVEGLAKAAEWVFESSRDPRGRHMITLTPPSEVSLGDMRPFDQMSSSWCLDALEEVLFWSGGGSGTGLTYRSHNYDDVLWVQTIASLAGYRTQWGAQGEDVDIHSVQVCPDDNTTGAGDVSVEELPGETVYGIEVPSSYLLTRLNGSVVITGNSVHGYYIGYKFQRALAGYPEEHRKKITGEVYELLYELYENEVIYTEELYDPLGWTEDVKAYLRYNANKALANLGMEPLFPEDTTKMSEAIRSSIDPGAMETHDFFSGSSANYFMPRAEATEDDDWAF